MSEQFLRVHWSAGVPVSRVRLSRVLVLSTLVLVAVAQSGLAQSTPFGRRSEQLGIEIYIREDSEQCQKAREYLEKLVSERPGLSLHVMDVVDDSAALRRLWDLAKRFGKETPKLPTIYMTDRLWVGFGDETTTGRSLEAGLVINAWVRPTCPHCQAAKVFLDDLDRRWPAIDVRYHDVTRDRNALSEVQQLARHYRTSATSLPCIQVADRFLVGYQSASTTGRKIESYLRIPAPVATETTATMAPDHRLQTTRPTASHTQVRHARLLTAGVAFPSWLMAGQTSDDGDAAATEPPPAVVEEGRSPLTDSVPDEAEPLPIPDEAELPIPGEADVPESANGRSPPALPVDEVAGATPESQGEASSAGIEVELFGERRRLEVRDYGLPAFTFLIGLVDGFNPCAMWVLIFLLSILVNIQDRKKILAIAGVFVLVSGLAYYAFMAAWLNVFELIGLQRHVQIGLGLLAVFVGLVNIKDFFAFRRGLTLSIPDSAKPGIARRVHKIVSSRYLGAALAGAIVLAVMVNVIELLCTAGLPALYTQILTMQQLSAWANYAYLALYITAYMLDDTLMLGIAVVTLSNRRMQESEGRWLKFLSGLVILGLGLVMLLRPEWLAAGA